MPNKITSPSSVLPLAAPLSSSPDSSVASGSTTETTEIIDLQGVQQRDSHVQSAVALVGVQQETPSLATASVLLSAPVSGHLQVPVKQPAAKSHDPQVTLQTFSHKELQGSEKFSTANRLIDSAAKLEPEGALRNAIVAELVSYYDNTLAARQALLKQFTTGLSSPSQLRESTAKDALIAVLLSRLAEPKARQVASTFYLSKLVLMAKDLSDTVTLTDGAYDAEAIQLMRLDAARTQGELSLDTVSAKRLTDAIASINNKRELVFSQGTKVADKWTHYLTHKNVSTSLKEVPTHQLAQILQTGMLSLAEIGQRAESQGTPIASIVRLGQLLRDDLVLTEGVDNGDGGEATLRVPHLVRVLTMDTPFPAVSESKEERAHIILDGESAPMASPKEEIASAGWDPLHLHDFHHPIQAIAITNWTRVAMVPMVEMSHSMSRIMTGPEMSLRDIGVMSRVFTRSETRLAEVVEHFTLEHSSFSHTFRQMGALAAVFEAYFAYGSAKSGEIDSTLMTLKMGFYATEVAEFLSHTKWGLRAIEKPLEKGFEAAAVRLAGHHAAQTGAKLGTKAIPILGSLLAAGCAVYEASDQFEAGRDDMAYAKSAEAAGWATLGAGAGLSATGMGAVVGLPVMVAGGTMLVGSYAYALFFAPNEDERLAESMGFVLD